MKLFLAVYSFIITFYKVVWYDMFLLARVDICVITSQKRFNMHGKLPLLIIRFSTHYPLPYLTHALPFELALWSIH